MQISLGKLAEQKHYSDSNAPLVVTAAAKTLDVGDTSVLCDTTSNGVAIKLPPVGEAAGRIYGISCSVRPGSNDITVNDYGDETTQDAVTLNAVGETAKFYSDGNRWADFTESV
jgi:hypothetical protein